MSRLLVVDYVGAETGVRTFLRSLLPALADAARTRSWEIRLVLPSIDYHGRTVDWAQELTGAVHVSLRGDASHRDAQQFRDWAEDAVAAEAGDVVYFPFPYLASCPKLTTPIVATFHDFNYKRFGTWGRETRLSLEEQMPTWIQGAAPVVSSRFVADELVSYYPEAVNRVSVVPLGVPLRRYDHDEFRWLAFRGRYGIVDPFVFSIGWLAPHKNQAVLMEALAMIPRAKRPMLVLVGPNSLGLAPGRVATESYARHLRHLAHGLGLQYGQDYLGTGRVDDAELDMLYAHASGLIMPTLYEAGSFPVREAAYAGCPVACSRIPPLIEDLERMRDDAAVTFDPYNPGQVAGAIIRLVEERSVNEAAVADRRSRAVAAFDWRRTASGYWTVIEAVATPRGSAA